MKDSDIKKLAKVVQIVLDKQMDGLKEEFRKIVRSEIEYALEKNGGAPQQKVMNDNIPDDKIDEIRSAKRNSGSGKAYKDPKDMIAKMRKMNEDRLDPNRDVYVDEKGKEMDLSENNKVNSLKNRDYSSLIE